MLPASIAVVTGAFCAAPDWVSKSSVVPAAFQSSMRKASGAPAAAYRPRL